MSKLIRSIVLVGLIVAFISVNSLAATPNPDTFLSPASRSAVDAPLPDSMVRLPGHVLAVLDRATMPSLGPPGSGARSLNLTLVLRRDNEVDLKHYLKDVYDSHSKNFRHFLSPKQISDRFGPSQHRYETVLSYLRHNGFKIVDTPTNRMTISVSAPQRIIEKEFFTSRMPESRSAPRSSVPMTATRHCPGPSPLRCRR